VHTHGSKAGILGRLAAKLAGTPVIVHTFHSLAYMHGDPWWKRLFYLWVERMAARWCAGLLSVTQDVVDRADRDRIATEGKCTVARSGMDLDRFLSPKPLRDEIRARWDTSDDSVVVGMIGRVHVGKGQDVLVDLARQLCSDAPRLRLVVIGTGPMLDDLTARVAQMGLSDRVRFIGAVPPDEMPEVISALDVLLHISRREGLARVIVQALACGKPVISYDLDGSPEVIADGVNGRLIAPDDTAGLIDAIVEMVEDDRLRKMLGDAGPAAVNPGWRVETMIEQIGEAYRRYLAQAGIALRWDGKVPPFDRWETK